MNGAGGRRGPALVVAAGLVVATAVAALLISGTPPNRSTSRAILATHSESWSRQLIGSTDIGPSHASSIEVDFGLATGSNKPTDLIGWAARHGLHVLWVKGEPASVISGSAAAFGNALGDPIHEYRTAAGHSFYRSINVPSVPTSLRRIVTGIGTISSYGTIVSDPVPAASGVPSGGLTPSGLLRAYSADPLASAGTDGSGETIVFLEVDGYKQADLNAYATQFTPKNPLNPVVEGGMASSGGEAPMDLEAAHGIAPGARLVYWNLGIANSGQLPGAFASAVTRATANFPGAIYSVSLGFCEQDFNSTDIQTAAAAVDAAEKTGSSFYVASGDNGGEECVYNWGDAPRKSGMGVQFPSDLPNVTAVGGTSLDVATSGAWLNETSWSEPLLSGGSTGGVSTLVPMPAWQSGPGVVSSASSAQSCGGNSSMCREIPDVSADSDPATSAAFVIDGAHTQEGGTSLATPIWAGLTALIDEYLRGHGDARLGFGNPYFYALASRTGSSGAFHDITAGGNDWYSAGPGYDMVTGIGSPIVSVLAAQLVTMVGKAGS